MRLDALGECELESMEHEGSAQEPDTRPCGSVGEIPRAPSHDRPAVASDHDEWQEQVVALDDAEPDALEHRSQRIQHHDLGALRAEHRWLKEDRRKEYPEGQEHLDDVLDVSEEQIRA